MKYIPATDDDRRAMLRAAGADSIEDLFDVIPGVCRTRRPLELPGPLPEHELLERMQTYAAGGAADRVSFLGAGVSRHFIPSLVDAISCRGEFLTAYTAYQPELSQGILQATFEYQTMIAALLRMEVSNASLYDGASACAEAALMALRTQRKRSRLILAGALHPEYRQTIQTYLRCREVDLLHVPFGADGRIDGPRLAAALDDKTAGVVIQSPNVFGVVEDLKAIADTVHRAGALLIVAFSEALAWGLLEPPGAAGADIVCGEGQSLGLPVAYGGPSLGVFTCRQEHIRQMPGRVVGLTKDGRGQRAFCLTLSTREQHIRREKATSNICTNQAWCALRAALYLSALGRRGLREVAMRNRAAALHAAYLLNGPAQPAFAAPFFNEFVVAFETEAAKHAALERWETDGLLGGVDLERFDLGLDRHVLSSFSELHTPAQIERWARGAGARP